MTNQVNEVLAKIREVCDLKRLEFGCEVYVKERKDKGVLSGLLQNGKKRINTWDGDKEFDSDKHEIIGLPVQLNHLLLALEQHYADNLDYFHVAITGDGQFVFDRENTTHKGRGYVYLDKEPDGKRITYDLQKSVEDNLRSNPELTKWVHGVIIGNE